MVKYCCARGCKEKFVKGGPVTFHRFPRDETRRRLWEKNLNRENFRANHSTPICSKHFTASCFETEKYGGTWLKADAVPTIFGFPPVENEAEDPEKIISKDQENSEEKNNSTVESLAKEEEKKSEAPEEVISEQQRIDDEPTKSYPELFNKRKRCYYIGDFQESDMSCPEKAVLMLQRSKEEKQKDARRIRNLQHRNELLKMRVASLKQTCKEARKTSSKTDTPSDVLKNSKIVPVKEKGPISHETAVKIKEEPMDFHPDQSSPTEISSEFILPHKHNTSTCRDSVVEPQFTLSVACLAPPSVPQTSDEDQLEKKPSITFVPSTNTSESTQLNSGSSFGEFSNVVFLKGPYKDKFQAFGEYVVTTLRSLDLKSSAFAQKAIRDILEAEAGYKTTAKINP